MRKKSFYRSDYGSFIIGIGSLGGVFSPYFDFNSSPTERMADRRALEADFGTIGGDMEIALSKFR